MSFLKRLVPMKAKVWITLDKPSFVEGEAITGKVNIDSKEYVPAEEVRVEARVFENYQEPVWVVINNQRIQQIQHKKDTLFSNNVRCAGVADLGNGSKSFPFSVGMPSLRPTHYGGSVQNSLKGVVAVKGRPDVTGEVNVGFAPPGSVPYGAPYAGGIPPGGVPGYGPAQQVITREIVKVRCKYCDGMMDASANQCPNCGARQ